MRGPLTTPSSMARLSPNTGPPTSRTVVKPRIRVSVASSPATRLLKPTSPVACNGVGRASIACQCMSISPGVSVRPPPSMIVVVASRQIEIGPREILSISLPRTNTFVGSDKEVLLPSKTLALLKRVTAASTCWPCAILAEKVSAQARIAGAKDPTYRIQPSLSHVFMGCAVKTLYGLADRGGFLQKFNVEHRH